MRRGKRWRVGGVVFFGHIPMSFGMVMGLIHREVFWHGGSATTVGGFVWKDIFFVSLSPRLRENGSNLTILFAFFF